MIRVCEVSKRFGRVMALDRVSLSVERGEVVLLLGANGAGKSTLLRCILGTSGYQGRIEVDGRDSLRQGKEVRRRIGYVPQGRGLHADLTVAETLQFHAQLRGVPVERARELLAKVRLESSVRSKVGELSEGMAQRLAFALALVADPPVLLLDEPTASLDEWSRDFVHSRLWELREQGTTILLSTHSGHRPLDWADRAATLREGILTEGFGDGQDCAREGSRAIQIAHTGGVRRCLR